MKLVNPFTLDNHFSVIYQQFIYEASSLQIKSSSIANHSNSILYEILLIISFQTCDII